MGKSGDALSGSSSERSMNMEHPDVQIPAECSCDVWLFGRGERALAEPLWRGVRQEIAIRVMLSGFATASRDSRPVFPRASTSPRESTNGVSMQGTSADGTPNSLAADQARRTASSTI